MSTIPYPPGPEGQSYFGLRMARQLQDDSLGFLGDLTRQYGDAVRFRFFMNFYGYIFTHPEHNRHILQENSRNYTKEHPSLLMLRPVIGNGLITSDGDFWLQQRRLIQPAFHHRRIAGFGEIMTGCTVDMLERWQDGDGQPLDVALEMMRLTLRIVCMSLFSIDISDAADIVGREFTYANHHVAESSRRPFAPLLLRVPTPGNLRFRRAIRELDKVVYRIIEARRRDGQQADDLLGMLMAARDEGSGAGMDDRQLRDEVMTLLLAGHETTANLLSWTFYLLSGHPEVESRLRSELEAVLHGRLPSMESLAELKYTRMVLDEVLRLYPPAYALGRLSVEPDQVGGYRLPAKAVVTLSPYLTHRHPGFWDDPETFDPERFTPERAAARPRFAYLPFGGGPRKCIGNTFALTEAALLLATILQRFSLRLVSGHPVEMEPLITLRPRYGLPMHLTGV